jgi:putative alpha-1,2-mannosidase
LEWAQGFTEGNAWQYRFYVPHDVEGLANLYEGQLCEKVKDMLEDRTSNAPFHLPTNGVGPSHEMVELAMYYKMSGEYAHGNQPSHHILWLAKKAGCNAIADKWLRFVSATLYSAGGWSGDEDNGEMSSWYILSNLGLYQLAGAKDELVLGSPLIKQAAVKLPNNKVLKVKTENQDGINVYVQAVTWTPDGGAQRTITDNVIKYTDVMKGGELMFVMGKTPKVDATPRLRGVVAHDGFGVAASSSRQVVGLF